MVFGLSSYYYEAKKQQNLVLTKRNLSPTAEMTAIDEKGKPVSSSGLSCWDKDKGRYRTYFEQQEAVKEYDTSGSMPPIDPKADMEIEKLIREAHRYYGKKPPVHPAA